MNQSPLLGRLSTFTVLGALCAGFLFMPANNALAQNSNPTKSHLASAIKKGSSCFAYTTCPSGYTVSCTASGAGCSVKEKKGKYVECAGYDSFGSWKKKRAKCDALK